MTAENNSAADFIALCEERYATGAFDVWLVVMFPDGAELFRVRLRLDIPDGTATSRLDALLQDGGQPGVIIVALNSGSKNRVFASYLPGHDDERTEAAAIEAVATVRGFFEAAGGEGGPIRTV